MTAMLRLTTSSNGADGPASEGDDARAGGGLPLIGVDADPEVGHHDGETDRHDYDQHILGSVAPTNAAKVKKALANPEPSTHGGTRLPGRAP